MLKIFLVATLAALIVGTVYLFATTQQLQTQINELKIIVDQKYLPAMILDELNVR